MLISVVIPAFNEEGNIGRLVRETFDAVPEDRLGEVVVVDDCSTDATVGELTSLKASYPKLRIIRHLTNAGQSASLRSGIVAARFPVIAQMDGDGQNDPRDIPALLARLGKPGERSEPALVGGVRTKRRDTGSKRWASKFANWLRASILKDDCPDTGCGIKVYWREAFLKLPFFTSVHRYLPALFQTYGYKTAYAPVNDRPRVMGVSKYNNFNRALIGIYDLFGVTWLRRRTRSPDVTEI
ncbi:MAG: glycosyltransferase family 2 protein [Nitratireductor sp.]|nr:glycosyltransferase family 2 protein [Nitratireductor sp.]